MANKMVLERAKWGKHLIIVSIATTFGAAVPVGYNIGVINAPATYIQEWCVESFFDSFGVHLTPANLNILWSAIVSVFLVGGAVGSLGGAYIADRLGRKRSLLTCALLFVVSAILFFFCRMANSVIMLIIARLIVGLASGLTTSTLPMYMAELSPLQLRGTLGVLCSMGVTGGVVVGQIGSLQEVFGTPDLWHVALSVYAVLVVACMLPYYWFPESPKYLFIIVKDCEAAKRQLQQLRGSQIALINEELQSMENESVFQSEKRSLLSVLRDPKLLLPVILVCALQGGQQLSGINAVFYYSVSIFERSGLNSTNAKWANLGAGCINLFIAGFSPYLMAKVNRRPLAFYSCLVSGVMLAILTVIVSLIELATWLPYACIVAVFGYIIAYQMGLGPIPYFIGTELFESAPRPAAMALGSLSSWTCNFIVGMSFPSLQEAWNAFVFIPFAVVCFALSALLKFYLPETRGRDSSDIAPLVSEGFRSRPLIR
ncbi:solute carrier family 2, facilitated glucose transporter member 1-like isoform X2 [Bradysia coprophila]|uniref:solute carrier family 2, facilitated glucose transporter member 1-like isoform X2 n=1 Tax=Bradysia coprophila TaxID=38358 RepID=UPI00187D7E9C|nr:solute carrier family 2, facilitated glucose transporter member 1-like isoform X2 [Bradysia coprophila]XP_037034949.1 solute carrier family 2, facilitated glucose transporter member 1-like isoform X2 [Bradysia coprophila]